MTADPRTCEGCGRTFGCGAQAGGCWCEAVTVDAQTLARLRAEYERCLCPECLVSAAAAVPSPSSPA